MNNQIDIFSIIQNSAECKIISLYADDQRLMIDVFHDELNCIIKFRMKYKNYYSDFNSESFTPCFLKLNEISEDLTVQNGVYIAANLFENFMKVS